MKERGSDGRNFLRIHTALARYEYVKRNVYNARMQCDGAVDIEAAV